MKKIYRVLLICFLSVQFNLNASHIAGGDLDIQWISGNDYRITLKLFRDCANAGAGFDDPISLTMYENGSNNFVTQFDIFLKESNQLSLGDECFTPPSSVCMEEGIYTLVRSLPNNSNGYYFAWERCCRSPLNLNIDQDQAMVFYAQIPDPALNNSTPKFSNYPANGYMCINEQNFFDFGVTDVDGDDLVFSLITPLSGSQTSPFNPVTGSAGTKPYNTTNWSAGYSINNIVGGAQNMSIDPTTGIITCSPTQSGAFTFAVLVEEFRNGVKISEIVRDIQFFALDCQKQVASINQTPTSDDTALEGCIKARFIFELDQSLSKDTTICYSIEGTAINGVDYAYLDDCITIPAGQTESTIIIDAFSDGLTEGREDIYLIYNPIPCVDFVKDTVFLFIDDSDPIDFTIDETDLTCNDDFSGEIDATITGGFAPYDVTITPDGGQPTLYSSTDLPITGLAAGTYTVQVDDIYGCNGEAQIVGNNWTGGPVFLPDGNGDIISNVLPISGLNQATLQSPDELQSICLNMEHSSLGDVSMRLIAPDGTVLVLKERFNQNDGGHTDLGEPVAKNNSDGGNAAEVTPGIGFDYCFTATPTYATMVDEHTNYQHTYVDQLGKTLTDNYLPSGSYTPYAPFTDLIGVPLNGDWTIEVEDHNPNSNGYIFEWGISFKIDGSGSGGTSGVAVLTEPDPIDISLNGTITQAACNGSDGSIDIDVVGDFPNFSFAWDDAGSSTTEDISGLPAGNYTVIVTDQQTCSNSATFNVSNATGPSIAATVIDENCDGDDDGSISTILTTSGSIASTTWDSGQNVKDISGLSPGDYTITVTDNSGCVSVETFTIDSAEPIYISGTVTNEVCGNQNGEIDITVVGGDGNYTFSWSNGSPDEDITGLSQDTYTVTVTDGNNCSEQLSFDLINTVGNCSTTCDLAITSTIIVDEACGQNNGGITLSIYTTNLPQTVVWDNGMTGSAISGLSAGDYTATITDDLACEIIETYTIVNDAGTLSISNPVITNETCGTANGEIEITVTGGDANYIYSWSNSSGSEDITNLAAGDYTILVTDGTGCSTSETYTLSNDAGSMSIGSETTNDETCSNGQGSIDITITSSGSYTFDWNGGFSSSQNLSNLSAGDYTCVITDVNSGCQLTTSTYTINNDPGTLQVALTNTLDEVCGNSLGEIDLTISGGTPGYDALWNTLDISEDLSGLTAGTYSATVSDQSGCTANTGDIIIHNLPGNLQVFPSVTDETCSDGSGSIELSIVNAANPIDIMWNTLATTNTIDNLNAGVYTYVVTDGNGCEVSSSSVVENNPGNLSIDSYSITHTECNLTDGAIDATVSGGDGNYDFDWSNGATTEDINGLIQGDYTLILKDGAGCETSGIATVNGALSLSQIDIVEDLCGIGSGSIEIEVSGGTNYVYDWSNGETTQNIYNLIAGSYIVVVDSDEGCTFTSTIDVNNDSSCNQFCSDSYSNSLTGTIYDSGGENGNYGDDENCTYLIQPECADSISLHFNSFRLENNTDFLSIYDGMDNTGTLIGSYTGQTIPTDISIKTGSIFIQFSSDISVNYSGFELEWTTIQRENCFEAMCQIEGSEEKDGFLSDSGGENGDYQNDEECTYLIQPNCVDLISLSILSFNTQIGDTLFVYSGTDDSGTILSKLSGFISSNSILIETTEGAMFLKFVSDGTSVSEGYKIQWQTESPQISSNFKVSNSTKFVNKPIQFLNSSNNDEYTYYWNFGDGTFSTESNPKHSYSKNGCYDVTLTTSNASDCDGSSTQELCVNRPIGIEVYPNPSGGLYTIDLNSEDVTILIYNLIGELVDYKLFKVNDFRYQLDITENADASYILRVNEEVFKIIKQD